MNNSLQTEAETLIKSNFEKAGFELMRDSGPKLRVKAKSGKEYAVFIQGFDRTVAQSIKVHSREFKHTLRTDVWIALVAAFPPEPELFDYLIPTTVFEHPDKRFFFHHDLSDMNDHYSNVEIKLFTRGAREFSEKYGFANQIENLK